MIMTFKTNYQKIQEYYSITDLSAYNDVLLRSICFYLDQQKISLSTHEIIKILYEYDNNPEYNDKTIKESVEFFLSKNKKE